METPRVQPVPQIIMEPTAPRIALPQIIVIVTEPAQSTVRVPAPKVGREVLALTMTMVTGVRAMGLGMEVHVCVTVIFSNMMMDVPMIAPPAIQIITDQTAVSIA